MLFKVSLLLLLFMIEKQLCWRDASALDALPKDPGPVCSKHLHVAYNYLKLQF